MNKLLAKIFVVIEIVMLGLVLFSYLGRHYIRKVDISTWNSHYNEEKYALDQDYWDYQEEVMDRIRNFEIQDELVHYDIENESEEVPLLYQKRSGGSSNGLVRSLSEAISFVENLVEKYTNANEIAGREFFVTAKASINKFLGLDVTNSISGGQNDPYDNRDIIVPTEDGQLGWQQDAADIASMACNLIDFGIRMQEQGRDFVIVENPNKYGSLDGYRDYSFEKYEQLHADYRAFGLDAIICEDVWAEQGLTESDIFYNTDFHWKPSAGILADGLVAQYLNENCGYDIDLSLFDPDNYDVTYPEQEFLGYLGKKATLAYTDSEPFEIWTPKYETNVTAFNSLDMDAFTGSVNEVVCWEEQLDPQNVYSGNMYDYYGLGDQAYIQIHNNLCNNGKRILVIKTSYANCMTPFLSSAVEDLDILDLRLFDGSVLKFIEENNPDSIIVVYGLSSYENFEGETNLFDFR